LILGFVILPAFAFFHIPGNEVLYDQFTLKVFLYAVFLPNVAFVFLSPVPYGFGLWSIGVEEQYYAVWPWLMRIKNIWRMIVTSLGIVLLIRVITGIMYINFPEESPWELLLEFLKRTRFSAMLIGAMGAYGLYRKKSFVKDLIFNKAIQFASLAVLAIFLTAPNGPPLYNTFKHEFVAIAALVIILNTAANPKSLIKLELRFLSWLGQVSYGFYIWHGVAVFVVIKAISLNFSSSGWLLHCFTLTMAFTITVVFSAISYNYLEKPFLKLKERFTVVPNRSAG
jgi:peptidoglycan/LPS O-acetylase OafA/YrhL